MLWISRALHRPLCVILEIKKNSFGRIIMNKTIIGKLGLIILLSICQKRVYSQQLLNFDFEKTSIEHSIRPWGWNKTTNALTEIGMDSIMKYEGKYSFRMQHE